MAHPSAPERAASDVLDNRYRLVALLGRGGFGDVWRAEEILPDGTSFREVALKLLTPSFADAAHWTEEAKLLASFRHPSLVTIYAAGVLEGSPRQPFVAMELLLGGTLADVIKERRRIPWRRVIRWARDVAAALDVIHARGVVHLDLKPANLFLSQDGAIKVLDFGISRRAGSAAPVRVVSAAAAPVVNVRDGELETAAFVAEQDALATTGKQQEGSTAQRTVAGTPGFMAPEVLELGEPTAATDAYALAVCIVQLTTGSLPHAVADQPLDVTDPSTVLAWWGDLRSATLRGELRDLTSDAARLPRGVITLLRRLLAVDPAQRGVSAGGLRAMLDEVWERPHGAPNPPYMGIAPFPAEAEGALFGREDDIARLGRELEFEPCVVVHGARGTGKSSLAKVGLVPHLARAGVDGKDDWVCAEIRPGEDPDAALRKALEPIGGELDSAVSIEGLAAWCERSPIGVVLVIDPLDELTTAGSEAGARLTALLSSIASGEARSGLRAVGVLGEEQTAALLATPLGVELREALRYVGAPSAAAVSDIVATPARLAGAEVVGAEEVVAEVQRELRAGDGRLLFAALALRAWWDAREVPERGAAPVLRGERWKQLGGVAGALAAHAEKVFSALTPEDRKLADEILLRMAQTDGTPLTWSERDLLDMMAPDTAAAARLLATLAREQLLRIRKGAVEVAHPALLTSFRRLTSLRLAEMERLVFLERLREAAIAWRRADEHKDFLLGDALLKDVRERRAWTSRGLTTLERRLVEESLRKHRWQIASRVAAAGAAALLIAGGLVAKRAYDLRQAGADAARRAAEERAYIAEVIAKARRTDDPYHRAAWIGEAMRRRSNDGTLPLDLAAGLASVAGAHFLTLEPVTGPTFPWNDRWLIGSGPGATLAVIDLWPPEPITIEGMNLDADPDSKDFKNFIKDPRVTMLRPHADPVVEKVPFAFDTSLATRSVSGEVRVFRLRQDGSVTLAAIAPMRCAGSVHAAKAAPVIACSTDDGIARWDLRRALRGDDTVDRHGFLGTVLDISPDGSRIAATAGKKVLLWAPDERREVETETQASVLFARWSPRDRIVALVHATSFDVLAMDRPDKPLLSMESVASPVAARWDDGGLDLALCGPNKIGTWYYLRSGKRPKSNPAPAEDPCDLPAAKGQPQHLETAASVPELRDRDIGPHPIAGGWKLPNGNILSRDLVLFREGPLAGSMLNFRGVEPTGAEEILDDGASARAAVRVDGALVAFQVGADVRIYNVDTGRRTHSRKGNLLRLCQDGRLLAWDRAEASFRIFDARGALSDATIPREPSLMLTADAACSKILTQRLDGTLVVSPLASGSSDGDAKNARSVAIADGYVYAVSPSPARGPVGGGAWLALSSGAVARFDDATGEVRLVGYATPRATAIADGPQPGDVAYADAAGVAILRPSGEVQRVLETSGGTTWEDLSVAPDGATMLLVSGERIAVLDLARREIVGEVPADGRSRFSAWDAEGSVLAWSFDRLGGAEGQVIPRGLSLALRAAEAASNLRVHDRRLTLLKR